MTPYHFGKKECKRRCKNVWYVQDVVKGYKAITSEKRCQLILSPGQWAMLRIEHVQSSNIKSSSNATSFLTEKRVPSCAFDDVVLILPPGLEIVADRERTTVPLAAGLVVAGARVVRVAAGCFPFVTAGFGEGITDLVAIGPDVDFKFGFADREGTRDELAELGRELVADGGRFAVAEGGRVAMAVERVVLIGVGRVVGALGMAVLCDRVRGLATGF